MTLTITPAIGFGTYQLRGACAAHATEHAISCGYRLIDTAFNYDNESAVARGISQALAAHPHIRRDDIILTSKLPGRYHRRDLARAAIEETFYRFGGQCPIDLYLIHWPNPRQGLFVEAWETMVQAQRDGLITHLGVSNFTPEHIMMLIDATGVCPVVNQVELHPYFNQQELRAFHEKHSITTCAWSPLRRAEQLLSEPIVCTIADAHAASPAQIVLAWDCAHGIIPIPKTCSDARQKENLAAITLRLSDDEIRAIDMLDRAEGRRKAQDPTTWEEF